MVEPNWKPPKRKKCVPPKVAANVLHRDGNNCQRCGGFRGIQLHHILPRSRGGRHTEENLTTLCLSCHDWAHRNPAKAKEEGWTL